MAWSNMNFRQRMGWVCLGLYMLASLALAHYMFDVSDSYGALALDRVASESGARARGRLAWLRDALLSAPLALWVALLLFVYLQVFCFLVSCTRTEPKKVGYCLFPLCLLVLLRPRQPRLKTYAHADNGVQVINM
ncbi:lysosomal enzyme trafficking factor [Petromyzon marinus]|uniref:lysosomal enzyme trafficking factor n=1 Tax=Petromyzon marinus TaxID=7757 RepID=UPI003F722AB3